MRHGERQIREYLRVQVDWPGEHDQRRSTNLALLDLLWSRGQAGSCGSAVRCPQAREWQATGRMRLDEDKLEALRHWGQTSDKLGARNTPPLVARS
jgi:hypothetical protein